MSASIQTTNTKVMYDPFKVNVKPSAPFLTAVCDKTPSMFPSVFVLDFDVGVYVISVQELIPQLSRLYEIGLPKQLDPYGVRSLHAILEKLRGNKGASSLLAIRTKLDKVDSDPVFLSASESSLSVS
jgi:hypothetical protein